MWFARLICCWVHQPLNFTAGKQDEKRQQLRVSEGGHRQMRTSEKFRTKSRRGGVGERKHQFLTEEIIDVGWY